MYVFMGFSKRYKGPFPQKENFVKCDTADTNFPSEQILKLKIFQLLTMIFSENFLSVEIFLEWKWAVRQQVVVKLTINCTFT